MSCNQSAYNLSRARSKSKRKGVTIVFALFLMTVLIGMLAFSIDIGYLSASKAELRRSADAAALAGCWQVYDSLVQGQNSTALTDAARSAAVNAAAANKVCNKAPALATSGQQSDVSLGYLSSLASTTLSSSSNNPYRAVRVRVSKTSTSNGEVPFFFGRIFGQHGQQLTAEATAAMALQVKGFTTPSSGSNDTLDVLPFALDETTWIAMLNGGGTDTYNYTNGSVVSGSDGIREVNLYPQGTGSPGNRGTVDIGGANNSTADIARQIVYGISAEDLQELGKPLSLATGGTMTLNGDTGISAGVKDELTSIIGQTRIIPIFSTVSGNGNNATYTIVRWAGVRILFVKLTGAMNTKRVIVQPAPCSFGARFQEIRPRVGPTESTPPPFSSTSPYRT